MTIKFGGGHTCVLANLDPSSADPVADSDPLTRFASAATSLSS